MGKKSADLNRAERARAAIEAQRRSDQRRRAGLIGAVVVAVVLLVGGGYAAMAGRDDSGGSGAVPPGMTDTYAVSVGQDSAPTTLTVYEDPQCPVCRDFEDAVGDDVAAAVEDGRVQVEYRVVSFLDGASENEYSSRAANALMAVQAEAGTDAFARMHEILFDNQPAEGTAGPDDDQLVAWAVEAGAEEADVRPAIEDGRYDQFVVNATDQMSKDGVNGTPTVFVDGEMVEGSPAEAVAAVQEAVS